MSATFCGTNTATTAAGTSSTFSHTLSAGADRVVIVMFGWSTNVDQDLTSVTYGGNAMTALDVQQQSNATTGARARIFYILEANLPADGAATIDPTWSLSEAGLDASCFAYCVQDCPSPVFTASGDALASGGINAYPSTVTAAALDANSLMFTMSTHTDINTGALSCDVGTQSAELNTAGQIRSRASHSLDTGASGDAVAIWSVASDDAATKAASVIVGIEYTSGSSTSSGWGLVA